MDLEIDQEAIFADLRARGVDYEGDEAWYLQHAIQMERDRRDRLELEQRLADEQDSREKAKADAAARLSGAWEEGGDAFLAEFNHQLGLSGEPGTDLPGSSACSAESDPESVDLGGASSTDEKAGAGATDWVAEALGSMSIPDDRMTREGWDSRIQVRRNRSVIRDFSRRVSTLQWEDSHPGMISWVKKFPFLHKAIKQLKNKNKNKEEIKKKTAEPGSPDLRTSSNTIDTRVAFPACLPAWRKLPAREDRPADLEEIITGCRIASIAFDDLLTPADWLLRTPGEEVACLSIDLRADASKRFLAGEHGAVGAALHRSLRRRLERDMGDVAMGVIWARPAAESDEAIRLFLVIRSACARNERDMECIDRSQRYYRNLLAHEAKFSPGGPLYIPQDEDAARYFGVSVEELKLRRSAYDAVTHTALMTEIDEQEFSPETGFASKAEIPERASRSHATWRRYAAMHDLPKWFNARFVQRLQDCLVHGPEHARERQSLKNDSWASKSKRSRLLQLQMVELPAWNIQVFRGSPAQLAAHIFSSGVVLDSHWDSRHKAGCAKDLYAVLRLGE